MKQCQTNANLQRVSPAALANFDCDFYKRFKDTNIDSNSIELIITGVPVNSDGDAIWDSVEDLVHQPYTHGLLEAISTISQIIKHLDIYLIHDEVTIPKLNVRFEAKITDVFSEDSTLVNPIAWIHLGHGIKEHDFREISPYYEWDDPEIEAIPGISNGCEEKDFLSALWLSDAISSMKGEILFTALPICFGAQIGEILKDCKNVLFLHTPYSFAVSDGLEFYDCDNNGILKEKSLHAWTEWVAAFQKKCRDALIEFAKK